MTDFLNEMAESSRARVEAATRRRTPDEVQRSAMDQPEPRPLVLHPRFDLFAEIKLQTPSAGTLAEVSAYDRTQRITTQARAYTQAAAISVLTEPRRFGGHLADLATVSLAMSTPTMRKDFLVDPIQVWEAREAGASGVLIIVRMLGDGALDALTDAADRAGLFVVAEAFDTTDLARCTRLVGRWRGTQPMLVGVNVRDLTTLKVDPHRLAAMAPHLPTGVPAVAESGMETPEDVSRAASLGYRAALVGGALMRSEDPLALSTAMLEAGRALSAAR